MRQTMAAAILAFATLSVPAAAQEVMKFGGVLPPQSPIVTQALQPWMRAVEKDSGGGVAFQEFWGGQLVRTPAKQLEAVLHGLQDASYISAAYTQQRFPEVSVVAYPYVVRDGFEASFALWRLYEKGMLSGFEDIYLPGIFTNDHAGIHLAKRIETFDQVKGMKIRISGPDEADILKLLGVAPVAMNINGGAEAMHRGVVDGTFNAWAATASFRMAPLVKTWIDEPLGVRPLMVVVSRASYAKLPEKARHAMDRHSGLAFTMRNAEVLDQMGAKLRKESRSNPAANVIELPQAERARKAALFKPLVAQWIAETANGAAKYAAFQEALAEYRKTRR